jgi:hypothetical protein
MDSTWHRSVLLATGLKCDEREAFTSLELSDEHPSVANIGDANGHGGLSMKRGRGDVLFFPNGARPPLLSSEERYFSFQASYLFTTPDKNTEWRSTLGRFHRRGQRRQVNGDDGSV